MTNREIAERAAQKILDKYLNQQCNLRRNAEPCAACGIAIKRAADIIEGELEAVSESKQTYLESQESSCEECRRWLVWADNLTGNKHYLASKMRREVSDRLTVPAPPSKEAEKGGD